MQRYPLDPYNQNRPSRAYNSPQERPSNKIFWILGIILFIFIAALVYLFINVPNFDEASPGSNNGGTELPGENSNLKCKLQSQIVGISLLEGVSGSVSISGFQGNANQVSWDTEDSNIASVNQSSGAKVMIRAKNAGSTKIIVTDNAVGSDCAVSIIVDVTSIYG